MPASRPINNEKSNRLVTQAALEKSSDYITSWWSDAFLNNGEDATRQFFLEAGQTLPMLVIQPSADDVIDAMKLHRIRLAKDQGLRPWEPRHFTGNVERGVVVTAT